MSDDLPRSSDYQIESITCPACHNENANVITHLLDIPYYNDFVSITIHCPQCGYRTTDFMNTTQKDYTIMRYLIEDETDGTTKVVRSTQGTVTIAKLGISIEPHGDGSTWIRNIEGILEDIKEKLVISLKQEKNKEDRREIKRRLKLLKSLLNFEQPFLIEVEDPSGNSIILPAKKEKLEIEIFELDESQEI